MDPVELAVQRRLTKAFIDTKPDTITLVPQVKTKTSGGGVKTELGTPRDPIVVRMNEAGTDRGANGVIVRTGEGQQRNVEYLVIAEHDVIMQNDDVFTYRGDEYIILHVLHDNLYETRGLAVRRGF